MIIEHGFRWFDIDNTRSLASRYVVRIIQIRIKNRNQKTKEDVKRMFIRHSSKAFVQCSSTYNLVRKSTSIYVVREGGG